MMFHTQTLFYIATVPLMCWLNVVRGGKWGGQYIHIVPDFAVAPFVALLAYLCGVHVSHHFDASANEFFHWVGTYLPDWVDMDFSAAWPYIDIIDDPFYFMATWLCWSTPAWGQWLNVDLLPPPDRPLLWYEKLVNDVSFGSQTIGFGVRATVCLLPMTLLFSPFCILLGPLQPLLYRIGGKLFGVFNHVLFGEATMGIAFGVLMVWLGVKYAIS